MVGLDEDALERTLRLAFEIDWDEIDIDRELERRRFLRAAALVCRDWASVATALLAETIVARRLEDFDAVNAAAEAGALRLERVRTLVLDETLCRGAYGEGGRPRLDNTGVVDGEAAAALVETRKCWEMASMALLLEAWTLAGRSPQLRRIRTVYSRTIDRVEKPWPIRRLACWILHDRQDDIEGTSPDARLWAALTRSADLIDLSIFRVGMSGNGLRAVPRVVCRRLRDLRLGVIDGHGGNVQARRDGLQLASRLFAGPTPQLRSLDLRLGRSHRTADVLPVAASGDEDGQQRDGAEGLRRYGIGWPSSNVRIDGVGKILAALPPTIREIVLKFVEAPRRYYARRMVGFELVNAVNDALLERRHVVGLVRLDLDLTGFGLDEGIWRAHARLATLQATCDERRVTLGLKLGS